MKIQKSMIKNESMPRKIGKLHVNKVMINKNMNFDYLN